VTVYVHKLPGQGGFLYGRTPHPSPWFGLTAETEDELQKAKMERQRAAWLGDS
jgi:hypothetical protein